MLLMNIFAYFSLRIMTPKDIIDLIKKVRKGKGLTQKDMASSLEISFAQYNNYETGRSEMTLSTFFRILDILEVGLKEFLSSDLSVTKEDINELETLVQRLKDKI